MDGPNISQQAKIMNCLLTEILVVIAAGKVDRK